MSAPPVPLPLHPRFQRRAHFFVEHEQVLNALALGGEAGAAVEPVDGTVEGPMAWGGPKNAFMAVHYTILAGNPEHPQSPNLMVF